MMTRRDTAFSRTMLNKAMNAQRSQRNQRHDPRKIFYNGFREKKRSIQPLFSTMFLLTSSTDPLTEGLPNTKRHTCWVCLYTILSHNRIILRTQEHRSALLASALRSSVTLLPSHALSVC
jgi:hypothetical protein